MVALLTFHFIFLNDSGLHVMLIYLTILQSCGFLICLLKYCSDFLSIITVMYLLSINQQMLIQPLLGMVGAQMCTKYSSHSTRRNLFSSLLQDVTCNII